MSSGRPAAQFVDSVTFIDSSISTTGIGILIAHVPDSQPPAGGSLILNNVVFTHVGIAIEGKYPTGDTTALAGGSFIAASWGEGHSYTSDGPQAFVGPITPVSRPPSLLVQSFLSARSLGATGNGHSDDTAALQHAILTAKTQGKILFVDHGDYLVSSTIYIPAGSRIVGESYSVILSHGSFFNNINTPQPVVQIAPSGIWDVHVRVGGFAGSNLQLANCPTTANITVTADNLDQQCIAAFMTMHLTTSSSGLYLENVGLWIADHDSQQGTFWMVGTVVEHHVKYQYQFADTHNVFAGQIQTETACYQPNPSAPLPFPYVVSLNDPVFPNTTAVDGNLTMPAADGWGLRIVGFNDVDIYGAGLYSFFDNYSTNCSNQGSGEVCQNRIFEDVDSSVVTIYTLRTVGTHYQIELEGADIAYYADDLNGFIDTIALFRD
ncbi:hypothetical protein LTR49_024700 [Elasticomyces elasticus]|nr:hypothetical protein LTR49_024700 [Elasticomyces elasticus]